METQPAKPRLPSNILVRVFSFCVLVILSRFAYFVTVKGPSCDSADFCFFSQSLRFTDSSTATISSSVAAECATSIASAVLDSELKAYYSSVFHDLISEGFLSLNSKCLCIETLTGQDVAALQEIGVFNSVGISSKRLSQRSVRHASPFKQPFGNNLFDFEYTSSLDRNRRPAEVASEVFRTLKSGGLFIVHTYSANDQYSLTSLLQLFSSFTLIRTRSIDNADSSAPPIHEIILRKVDGSFDYLEKEDSLNGGSVNNCSVLEYKRELVRKAEPLILEEPLKPWIVLKRNMKNVKYLSSLVDISFKNRYIYVDAGARNYGSSIGSWFKKQYPKQEKPFEIYAIEADRAFHKEYRLKKGVTLLPYAAWVKNETLFFEINRQQNRKNEEKGRGMGRVQAVHSSAYFEGDPDKIRGFDFAHWLKSVASEKDYVVIKMDVEGAEFHLIPRLIETGTICLIDEMFLECHYNRWQRCCPRRRSPKYMKTYAQCLELFSSLRDIGVLVHQWW